MAFVESEVLVMWWLVERDGKVEYVLRHSVGENEELETVWCIHCVYIYVSVLYCMLRQIVLPLAVAAAALSSSSSS